MFKKCYNEYRGTNVFLITFGPPKGIIPRTRDPGGDCFRAWFARAVTQHQSLPGEADVVMSPALRCKPCYSSTNQGRRVLSFLLK